MSTTETPTREDLIATLTEVVELATRRISGSSTVPALVDARDMLRRAGVKSWFGSGAR